MPKKVIKKVIEEEINSLPEPEQEQEQEEFESDNESEIEEPKPIIKPKKVLSQKQQQHLVNMREKALEAKRKQGELTKKANEYKNIEKEKKLNEKLKEAEKYDNYIKEEEERKKQEINQEIQEEKIKPQPKQNQRKVKKMIYEDEDDDEDYSKLLATENLNKLHQRAMNERVFNTINSYMSALRPNYY